MPSIEISLSGDDSPCPYMNRQRSGSADLDACMALHAENAVTDLAAHVANMNCKMNATSNAGPVVVNGHTTFEEHSITIPETNHHFLDIIEINDEDNYDDMMEDNKESIFANESSSILDIGGPSPRLRRRGRRGSNSGGGGGVLNRFTNVVRDNFASRAMPGPAQDFHRVGRPMDVHFLEYRM